MQRAIAGPEKEEGAELVQPPEAVRVGGRLAPIYDLPAHVFRRAWQHCGAMFEAKLGHMGLTQPQFATLYAISLKPGMEQQELARAIHYDPVTTSGVLRRLEARGLLRRKPSGRSRRGRAIYLTRFGAAAVRHALPLMLQEQADVVSRLEPHEAERLVQLLSKAAGIENRYTQGDGDDDR